MRDPRIGVAPPRASALRWTRGPDGTSRRLVHLLRADEELGGRLSADDRPVADRQLVAPAVRVPQGRWDADVLLGKRPVAYLVLEGTLLRSCRVGRRWSSEILGQGDVLRPWDEVEGIIVGVEWQALDYVQLAIVEQQLLSVASRWPELTDELLARTVRRSRFLAVVRSVCAIRRLDIRLLVLLRLLAERWGRVSPSGVHVGVRLTHETLARVVGAQRPSVSATLSQLRGAGLLHGNRGELVLAHELPREVEDALGEAA